MRVRDFRYWPLATGHVPTADHRFRGTAEVRSPVPEVGGDAFDPEPTFAVPLACRTSQFSMCYRQAYPT
jgi:hypothetical protein